MNMTALKISNLPEAAIKDFFCRIYQESGSCFLTHFAAAVVSATGEEFLLIRPAAILLITKINEAEEKLCLKKSLVMLEPTRKENCVGN
jgi:hypothetical protein